MLEYRMDPLPETYQYVRTLDNIAGSFPFYCTEIGEYTMGDAYYTKRDGLQRLLLIVTIDGCGRMIYHGGNCLLERGTAVLIDCKDFQEYYTVSGQTWHFFYIHFGAQNMDGYREALIGRLTPIVLRAREYVLELFKQLYGMSRRYDILSYAAQSNAISNILTEMLYSKMNDGSSPFSSRGAGMAELAEYIEKNCGKKLHLDDFSRFTNLTKHHMIRLFERQMGVSPYQYMHLCRINRAQELLRTTDMTAAQIAFEVGYSDAVIFNRHFKAFNHVSPGEYRKRSIAIPKKE